jgi:hypothetical protein
MPLSNIRIWHEAKNVWIHVEWNERGRDNVTTILLSEHQIETIIRNPRHKHAIKSNTIDLNEIMRKYGAKK